MGCIGLTTAVLAGSSSAWTKEVSAPALPLAALKQMTLEDLMSIKVTSVSKKEEPLSLAASAVAVISGDDIRRSGVTTLPDALRLAPGVHVGRVDSHQWAVGVRGFNDTFAQNLLVLMDGRSVYTPLFSGVFWQAQDTMLEDLDRIEVIRGPGSTIWGANAVNGVINIVSKPAKETQGGLIAGGGGVPQFGNFGVRYGDKVGANTFFRVYGKCQDFDRFDLVGGGAADDAWRRGQGGFRLDHQASGMDLFTIQGDVVDLRADQRSPQVSFAPLRAGATDTHWNQVGGNLLGRWSHTNTAESELVVQTYFDYSQIKWPVLSENRRTYDLDIRHRFPLGERQDVVWGGGVRASDSHLQGSTTVTINNPAQHEYILNVFLQDEITLAPDRLRLVLGTKLEHNDYTGLEFEPGVRLAWTPHARQTIWASVARAVRTPSRLERGGRTLVTALPPSPPLNPFPTLLSVQGHANFNSEKLIAYELGYRFQPHPLLAVDAAAFCNVYDRVRAYDNRFDYSKLPAYMEIVQVAANNTDGLTYGAEVSASWQAATSWRLQASYSLLRMDVTEHSSTGPVPKVNNDYPEHMLSLNSSVDLSSHLELDFWVRYLSGLSEPGFLFPGQTNADPRIPGYMTLDLRLAWRPTPRVEWSLVGQNLLEASHREYDPSFVSTQITEVPRGVMVKLTWKF